MSDWRLIFEDGFGHDSGMWQVRDGKYWTPMRVDFDRADPSCVQYKKGQLRLGLRPDPERPGSYLTGHVGTESRFEFTYGRVETRARFHPRMGAHAAFWLQSTEWYVPGQAEVDVAECFGRNKIWHNVYWQESHRSGLSEARWATKLDQTKWHTYSVDWRPDRYVFSIDGRVTAVSLVGLSDRPKFLVCSMLTRPYETPKLVPPWSDYRADFDYVKVWQKNV